MRSYNRKTKTEEKGKIHETSNELTVRVVRLTSPSVEYQQSQPPTGKEKGRGEKLLNFVHLGRTRDSQTPPGQSQPPNGNGKGRRGKLLNFVGLGRTREQPSQSQSPQSQPPTQGKGKGRGRRFLDFIGAVGRTRKQPSHSEPPHSEPPHSESPHPESPQSETPQSQSPRPQSPQSQLLQHGSNATAASPKAHFEDDPVSRIRTLPHWHTAFLNFTPLVAEHVNVFITFTGSTAGTDADADKYSREDAGFMYARLRQWALVKLGDQFPRVSKMMYIPADKKLGTGSVWKLERIVDPISFEYWFDWDVAKGVKRPAYLPEYRNGDEFSFPGFDVQLEDHEEVYLETSDFLRRYHGIDL
ncbi:hypothetical protein FB446DRAFT_699225 [Lentinula raphanica]|nr:hypothetical protein FB446DRAFT_699225 [Lentinula raphanica]